MIGTEFWIEGKRQLSGLVRPAKDAQRACNYWASVATEVVALAPRTPFIGAAGQFEGFEHKWAEANTENHSYLEYNPVGPGGTLSPPPQRQQFAGVPAGMIQQMQLAQGDIQAALGMYQASVGAPSNEKSGISYDLFVAEAAFHSGLTQIITDDGDYATVAGLTVFTANETVIDEARAAGKLVTR